MSAMKENRCKVFKISFLMLLSLFIFHLINNFIVIKLNNTPLVYDAYENYNNAKDYFFNSHLSSYRPPLITFLSLPIFKLFGASQKAVSFGIGIYSLFVVLFTTYLLAKELYSERAGLLSAFILSGLPIIFGHSRTCMSDLLLAGWVTFSILLMIQAEAFISLKFVIPLGMVIGLGLLTRINYPLYVLGPFIYTVVKSASKNRKTYINLVLIILIAFSICLLWYLPNAFKTLDEYIKIGQFRLVYRIKIDYMLARDTLSIDWLGFVCVILFFLALLRQNRLRQPRMSLFLVWIAIPYFILLFMEFKNPRFIIPILPALAIIDSFYILNIRRALYRRVMIVFIVFLSLVQTIFISYFPFARIYGHLDSFNEWRTQAFGLLHPMRDEWRLIEICNTIRVIAPDVKKKIIFIKTRPLIEDGLRGGAKKCNFEILLSHLELCCMNLKRDELHSEDLLFSKLNEADIVLKAENSAFDDGVCENYNKLDKIFKKNIHNFNLVNSMSLPDGSRLRIYKSRNLP